MPEIPLREDYGSFINLKENKFAAKKPLAFYRIREGSVSTINLELPKNNGKYIGNMKGYLL